MPRILIIDDDEQIRNVLEAYLARQGYEVDAAKDGAAGIRLCRENPADVVITDIIMPEKEGIEVIQDLHREFPAVKIIAISGGGRVGADDYLLLAQSFGVQSTLSKPFELADLQRELDLLLSWQP